MPTLDELRKRFSAPASVPAAAAKVIADVGAPMISPVVEGVIWTADQIKRWTAKFDIISSGTVGPDKVIVKDLRFKFGRQAGKTITDIAKASGGGRGYLRWFYCETGMDDCIKSVIQAALGEDGDTISAKYNSVEK